VPLSFLAFASGVGLLQLQPALPGLLWCYALPLLVFAGALLVRSGAPAARPVLPLLFLAGGFLWASLAAHVRLADALPAQWEGRDVELTGVVAELPRPDERGVRARFDVEAVHTPLARVPRHISLTWYRDAGKPLPSLHPGQRWRLTARLRRPHGTANPHGFDSEVWMLERNLRAAGYVRPAPPPALLAPLVHRPGYGIELLRERIRTRILGALPGDPAAGILVALAIGDQPAIATQQWSVFTRTGVNHLMSISGLHITMVSGLVFAVVAWCWRRLPRAALEAPTHKAAAVAGLSAALLYGLLSGFGVPAQRTVTMLAIVVAALLFGRGTSAAAVLSVALVVVVLLDPWAILSAGFWLSFGAVALILYVGQGRLQRAGWLLTWARVQWAVTLGLIPLLLVLFQQVSIVSPLANAVAIPVVSLGVVPLTLLGLAVPTDLLLVLAGKLMGACYWFLHALSTLPEAVWQQAAPPGWTVPVALIGVLCLLAPRGYPARWLGAVALLPLLSVHAPRPATGELWLEVLDVGQGLAAVLRTANHTLLYDTGPAFSGDADSGSRIVVPYLRGEGVSRLDGLIVSHDDSDHSGGARSVLQALPVTWVASSLDPGHPQLALAARRVRCFAGQHWEWDGVRFEMLHPAWDGYNAPAARDNDRSCVLRVTAAGGSVLLTADIEQKAEAQLLAQASRPLGSEVLLVPHHGSATSSSHAFLSQIRPRIAVVPVGYRNRFGHPADAVLARYAELGATVHRTDRDGALLLRFGETVSVQTWRALHRRYWQEAG
jgi:competence protein ComEC